MVTADDVKSFLGFDALDVLDDQWVDASLAAAVAYVADRRRDADWVNPSADERLGLIMLAARFYERRGADQAGENAGYEFSGPIPLISNDILKLLRLGRWHKPVVA